MRTAWSGLTVDVADYEIVRLGTADAVGEVGAFRDVHVSTGDPWRLVAGYLMLESRAPGRLDVFSHGHHVATFEREALGWHSLAGAWQHVDGAERAGGVALIVHGGRLRDAGGSALQLTTDGDWAVSIVHGPAPEKIDNRIRLLESLQRVGGRRG